MKQADLNREVSRATGETVSFIDRMGFQLTVVPCPRPRRRHRHRRRRYWQRTTICQSA